MSELLGLDVMADATVGVWSRHPLPGWSSVCSSSRVSSNSHTLIDWQLMPSTEVDGARWRIYALPSFSRRPH